MNSHLYSPLLCLVLLLMGFASTIGGCYPHQGKRIGAGPDQLLARAHEACHRRDPAAWQMLLRRLAQRHPETRQAAHAKRLLDDEADFPKRCRHPLQATDTGH